MILARKIGKSAEIQARFARISGYVLYAKKAIEGNIWVQKEIRTLLTCLSFSSIREQISHEL